MTRSVLVVDDDVAFRELAARMLKAIGLGVAGEAASDAEAIAAANDLKPDAALVDVWLPDGDGITLAGELVRLPWRPRVILTSSDADAAAHLDSFHDVDISMSLDGFITGPNEGIEHPLGEDDGWLHDWMFDRKTAADAFRAAGDGRVELERICLAQSGQFTDLRFRVRDYEPGT